MAAHINNDPYLALHLSPDATAVDIKRAFRTLSLQYHPDRPGGDSAAFIRINDAYATLGDVESRAAYDRSIHDSTNIFESTITEENMEILMQMFQNRLFAAFSHKGKPPPIHHELYLTIQEMYDGGIFLINPLFQEYINKDIEANTDDVVHITIPRGVRDKEVFVISGGGRSFDDVHFGDLHITVHAIPHVELVQHGLDLIVSKRISLKEALCGCSFLIDHPSHIPVRIDTISNPIVISPNFVKTIKGLGFRRENAIGNLIIKLDIEFPTKISCEQRDMLRAAFEYEI